MLVRGVLDRFLDVSELQSRMALLSVLLGSVVLSVVYRRFRRRRSSDDVHRAHAGHLPLRSYALDHFVLSKWLPYMVLDYGVGKVLTFEIPLSVTL